MEVIPLLESIFLTTRDLVKVRLLVYWNFYRVAFMWRFIAKVR